MDKNIPKKRGPKVDPEKRLEEIEATQYLAVAIRTTSGKSSAELEEFFGLGAEGVKTRTGRTWNRYMNGERAMHPVLRDSIARKAIRMGWIKKQRGIITVLHERALCGANRADIRVNNGRSAEPSAMEYEAQKLWREKLLTHRKALLNEQRAVSKAQQQAIAALRGLMATLDSLKIQVDWWVPHPGYADLYDKSDSNVVLSDMHFRSDVDDLISKIEAIRLPIYLNGDLP